MKYNEILDRIDLQIPFELKDVIKTYKLVQWDPVGQIWHCSIEKIAEIIQVYEYMGGKLIDSSTHPNPLKIKLNDRRQNGIFSTDIQLLVKFDYQQTDQFIGTVDVNFVYDTNIINALKQLHPCLRSYNQFTHIWTIDILALPQFLIDLEPYKYTTYKLETPKKWTILEQLNMKSHSNHYPQYHSYHLL